LEVNLNADDTPGDCYFCTSSGLNKIKIWKSFWGSK
jgi:hypothetical protein